MIASWGLFAGLMVIGSVGIHLFTKLSSQDVNPLLSIFIAHIVATILIGFLYFIFKQGNDIKSIETKSFIWILLIGLSIAIANFSVIYMYKYGAPMSTAIPITRTAVSLFAVVIGIIFFLETVSLVQFAGFILSLVSIYMMTRS